MCLGRPKGGVRRDFISVAKWEEAILTKLDDGKTISEGMNRAIRISMCPKEVQDLAIQRVDECKGYAEMRDKLLSVVRDRVALTHVGGPAPMDVGEVDAINYEDVDLDALV